MDVTSNEYTGVMGRALGEDLQQFFGQRRGVSISLSSSVQCESALEDPPADFALSITIERSGSESVDGCLFVTYIQPRLYLVSIQVGESAYRSEIIEVPGGMNSRAQPTSYTHHLWMHVLRRLREKEWGYRG